MIIPVDSKKIKVLNDINQVLKKPFIRYYFDSGFAFTHPEYIEKMSSGFHFSYVNPSKYNVDDLLPHKEGYMIEISSDLLYKAIKDNKKVITDITIENNLIAFTGNSYTFPIGRYVKITEDMIKLYNKCLDIYRDKDIVDMQKIDNSSIELIYANEIVNCGKGDKRIRLTKPLIPHIKSGLDLYLNTKDTDNPGIFEASVVLVKSGIYNFHVFNCVKF